MGIVSHIIAACVACGANDKEDSLCTHGDEWRSHHATRHLVELAELSRQRACEAVGVEGLRLKRRGCGACESYHKSWRGVWCE